MVNIIKIILLYENVGHQQIIQESLRGDTKIIHVNSMTTYNQVLAQMRSNGLSHLENLGLMYNNENKDRTSTLERMPILNEGADYFGNNFINLLNVLKSNCPKLSYVDLLTCNIYREEDKEAIANLENIFNVNFRYSLDMTGPKSQGGDWILESDNANVKNVYFTDHISNYPQLLGVVDNFYFLESIDYYLTDLSFSPLKHHLYFKCNDNVFQPWTLWNKKMDEDNEEKEYVKAISYSTDHVSFLDASGDVYIFDKARFMVSDVYDLSNIAVPSKIAGTDLSGSPPYQSVKISNDGTCIVYIDVSGHLFKSDIGSDPVTDTGLLLDDDGILPNKYFFVSDISGKDFLAIDVSHNVRVFNLDTSHNPITYVDYPVDISANFINYNTFTDISHVPVLDISKNLRRIGWARTGGPDLSRNLCPPSDIMHYDGSYNDMYLLDTSGNFNYWNGLNNSRVSIKNRSNQDIKLISFETIYNGTSGTNTLGNFYLMTEDYRVYDVTKAHVDDAIVGTGNKHLILSSDNNNYYLDGNNIYYPPITVLEDESLRYATRFKPFQNVALRSNATFDFSLYKPYGDTFQELLMMGHKPSFNDQKDIIYPDFIYPPTDLLNKISFTDYNYKRKTVAGDLILPFSCKLTRKSTPNLASPLSIFKIVDISVYGVQNANNNLDISLEDGNLLFKVDRTKVSDLSENMFSEILDDISGVIVHPAKPNPNGYIKHADDSANINLRNIDISGLNFKGVNSNIYPLLFNFNFTMFKNSLTLRKDFVDTDLGFDGSRNEIKMYDVVFRQTLNPDRYTFDDDGSSEKVSRLLRIELFDLTTYGSLKIYKINDPSGNDSNGKNIRYLENKKYQSSMLIEDISQSTIEANKKERDLLVWSWNYGSNAWEQIPNNVVDISGYSAASKYYFDYQLTQEDVKDYDRFALHISASGSQGHRYDYAYNDVSSNVPAQFERLINAIPILDGEACIPYSVTTTKIGDFTVNVNNLDNDIHNFVGCAIELNIRGNEEGKFKMYNRFEKTYTNIEDFYVISYIYEIYYYSYFDASSNTVRTLPKTFDNQLVLVKTIEGVKSGLTYEFTDKDVGNWYQNAIDGNNIHPGFNADISGVLAIRPEYKSKGFFVSVKYKYNYRFADYDDNNPIDLAYHQRSFEQNIYYLNSDADTTNTYLKDTFAPIKYTTMGNLYNLTRTAGGWSANQNIRASDIEHAVPAPETSSIVNDIQYAALHVGRGYYHELDGVNENAIECENTVSLIEGDEPVAPTDLSKNLTIVVDVNGDISDNDVSGIIMEIDISYAYYKDISNNNGNIPIFEYYYDISGPYGAPDNQIGWRDISGSMMIGRESQFSTTPGKWCLKNKIQNLITPIFRIVTYQNRFYKGKYETVNINDVSGTFTLNLPNNEVFNNTKNIVGFHFYWGDKDGQVIRKFEDASNNSYIYNLPGSFMSFDKAYNGDPSNPTVTFNVSKTEFVTNTPIAIPTRIPYHYEKIIVYVELYDGIYPEPLSFNIFEVIQKSPGNLYGRDISAVQILVSPDLSYNNSTELRTPPVNLRIFHDISYSDLRSSNDYVSLFWGIVDEDKTKNKKYTLIERFKLSGSSSNVFNELYEDISLNSLTVPIVETGKISNAIFALYSQIDSSGNYIESESVSEAAFLDVSLNQTPQTLTIEEVKKKSQSNTYNINDKSDIIFDISFSIPVKYNVGTRLIMNNGGEASITTPVHGESNKIITFKYTLSENDIGTTALQIKKLEGKIYDPSNPYVNFIKDYYWKNNDFNLPSVSEPAPINIISNLIDANDDNTLDNNEIQSFIKQRIFNQ